MNEFHCEKTVSGEHLWTEVIWNGCFFSGLSKELPAIEIKVPRCAACGLVNDKAAKTDE